MRRMNAIDPKAQKEMGAAHLSGPAFELFRAAPAGRPPPTPLVFA